jgi:DNA-binding IclR family transcriptional regulator
LEGIYIRYAQVLETSQPLRAILKPGARDLFHTTALGRAIVARLPEQQQSRLIAKVCATEPAGKRRVARARLEAELAATRARGCAWEEEETVAGVACAAIALTALGEPLAAVSVAVPIQRLAASRRKALIKTLRDAA